MKKILTIICVALAVAAATSACSHKTCPAYRGSIAENVTVTE